jgi:hypothetical protein
MNPGFRHSKGLSNGEGWRVTSGSVVVQPLIPNASAVVGARLVQEGHGDGGGYSAVEAAEIGAGEPGEPGKLQEQCQWPQDMDQLF